MAEITGRVGWRTYVPTNNPLWNSLVAYYTGDNTPNDSKGTYNGTLVNGATYSTGKIGSAFSLDGINDYVNIPTFGASFSSPSSAHSYSAWVNTIGNGYNILIQNGNTGMGTMMGFQNSRLNMWYRGGNVSVQSTATISNNVWVHIASTYDGSGTIKLYINGALDSTFTGKTWIDGGGACATNIGSYQRFNVGLDPTLFFNGKIDEVGVWNRALTEAEVTELYNGGAGKQYVAPAPTSIITTGLVMNLDAGNTLSYAGTGTTWTDLSGNANNGTLVNGVGYSSTNGGTMVFDGINDMVSVAHSPNLNSTKITVSMWIKFGSSLSTDKVLFSKGSEGSRTYWFYESNGVYFAYGGFTGRIPAEILVNQWCNIVGVQTSTASLIYLNGVLYSSGAGAASITTTQGIGINSYSSNIYHASAKNIPQVAIYNRDLSASEVATNFAALKSRYGL